MTTQTSDAGNPLKLRGLNKCVESRLSGMRRALLAAFSAGEELSAATKGREREVFVKAFLSEVFSPAYRFGSDDKRSGQVDIVVESPYWYSLPAHLDGPRLYVAEGVAAVIEVKSNLMTQWHEVLETTAKVKQLRRLLNMAKSEADKLPSVREDIPCYAVGFTGWKTPEEMAAFFESCRSFKGVDAEEPMFRTHALFIGRAKGQFDPLYASGKWKHSLGRLKTLLSWTELLFLMCRQGSSEFQANRLVWTRASGS